MKVCIVGASGKLGQYMVQHALDRGYEVGPQHPLTADVAELTAQVTSIISASQFNGMNLLNDDGADLSVLSSIDRDNTGAVTAANITVTTGDFNPRLTATATVLD